MSDIHHDATVKWQR